MVCAAFHRRGSGNVAKYPDLKSGGDRSSKTRHAETTNDVKTKRSRGTIEQTSIEDHSNIRRISRRPLDRLKHLLRHLAYNMGRLTYHTLHTNNTNGIRYPGALNFDISKQGGLECDIRTHRPTPTTTQRSPCEELARSSYDMYAEIS